VGGGHPHLDVCYILSRHSRRILRTDEAIAGCLSTPTGFTVAGQDLDTDMPHSQNFHLQNAFKPASQTKHMRSEKDESEQFQQNHEPLDFSASSAAVDPKDAAQDVSESQKTGRHSYTDNATFTDERLQRTNPECPGYADAIDTDDEDDPRSYASLNDLNRYFKVVEPDEKSPTTTSLKSDQRKTDAQLDLQEWGRRIGLTVYEIDHALQLFKQTDDEHRQNNNALILAALTIVANKEWSNIPQKIIQPRRQHLADGFDSVVARDDMTSTFEEIRTGLGISTSEIKSARKYINKLA